MDSITVLSDLSKRLNEVKVTPEKDELLALLDWVKADGLGKLKTNLVATLHTLLHETKHRLTLTGPLFPKLQVIELQADAKIGTLRQSVAKKLGLEPAQIEFTGHIDGPIWSNPRDTALVCKWTALEVATKPVPFIFTFRWLYQHEEKTVDISDLPQLQSDTKELGTLRVIASTLVEALRSNISNQTGLPVSHFTLSTKDGVKLERGHRLSDYKIEGSVALLITTTAYPVELYVHDLGRPDLDLPEETHWLLPDATVGALREHTKRMYQLTSVFWDDGTPITLDPDIKLLPLVLQRKASKVHARHA
ncbi:Hypothetical protein POVN_LOCUS422 [uncultured virus]|nr:Hypothetical protein POVN_LOCUS422 [uncultured virus]